jgi:hypothetical protein
METGEDDEEDDFEDDEEEIEASLDEIIRERFVVVEDDEEDLEDDRAEVAVKVLPRQPDEFVCQSCFLVKNKIQMADKVRELCRDCV